MMHELRKLWYVLDSQDIELRPLYIRSAENVIADYASRLAFSGDYMLALARFEAVQSRWGRCTVDGFASPATALLPRYWTAAPIEGAEAVDAFAQDWRGELVWAHPPPSRLLELVPGWCSCWRRPARRRRCARLTGRAPPGTLCSSS